MLGRMGRKALLHLPTAMLCTALSFAQLSPGTERGVVSGTESGTLRVPAGLTIKVRPNQKMSAQRGGAEQRWTGVLASDLVNASGRLLLRAGAPVVGSARELAASETLHRHAMVMLKVTEIDGRNVETDAVTRNANDLSALLGTGSEASGRGRAADAGAEQADQTRRAGAGQLPVLTFTTE